MKSMKHSPQTQYIWLFGENLGSTHNNNSYYAWFYMASRHTQDGIAKYLILEKTSEAIDFQRSLPEALSDLIVWRNSLKHYLLYREADMLWVTLSYKDVVPDRVCGRKRTLYAEAPVIYLQHGVLGMKKIGYNAHSYNNNFFRFIYYNRNIKSALVEQNKIKAHQLFYGIYMPRYMELLNRASSVHASKNSKTILWFLTWREYKKNSIQEKVFFAQIKRVLSSEKLRSHLANRNISLHIVTHQFMKESLDSINSTAPKQGAITVTDASSIDLMDEIAQADCLVTDYSSVAFDFAFLEKPLLLFQPDLEQYTKTRLFYCDLDRLREINVSDPDQLVEAIVNNDFSLPDFFRNAFPSTIPYSKIENGDYIERLYRHFSDVQYHTITFLGYGFWGVGGTVTATKSLAESLAEKGYAIRMLSLKRLTKKAPANPPAGVRFSAFYLSTKTKLVKERLKRLLFKSKRHFEIIRHDGSISYLIPYAGWALKQYLDTNNSSIVVSTRESFHLALKESNSANKGIYFFHTDSTALEENFPGIMPSLAKDPYRCALFTTCANMESLEALGFHFDHGIVIGNTLESRNMLSEEQIRDLRNDRIAFRECDSYHTRQPIECATFLRLAKSRKDAVEDIIDFAEYLKQSGIHDIRISIFGGGELLDSLIAEIYERGVQSILIPCGPTNQPASAIRKVGIVIDFAKKQSFGMTYLEALFNGAIPLCRENLGSREVLAGHEYLYYRDWGTLESKIRQYSNMPIEDFLEIYHDVCKKYSHEVVAAKFLDLAFGSDPMEKWRSSSPIA